MAQEIEEATNPFPKQQEQVKVDVSTWYMSTPITVTVSLRSIKYSKKKVPRGRESMVSSARPDAGSWPHRSRDPALRSADAFPVADPGPDNLCAALFFMYTVIKYLIRSTCRFTTLAEPLGCPRELCVGRWMGYGYGLLIRGHIFSILSYALSWEEVGMEALLNYFISVIY